MKRILFALAALLAIAAACHPEVDPTSVTLNKHDLMLKVGGTEVLEATIEPANATNTALSWSSTAPSVATVDQNGKVTAVSDGNAVIMVATLAGAKTDACNVYVSKNFVSVTGVKLDRATLELKVGDRIGLAPTVEPEDASNKTITWSSSAPEVASVNENGTVEALKGGKATITVKTDDGGFTATCEVTVSEIIVADGVTVSPATAEISEGTTVQLSATVSPAGANQEVEWASQNTSVAKVDDNGLVTGIAKGTTRIYARSTEYPDQQGYCEVTVTQDATLKGISLSPSELTLTIGQTSTLTVIYTPEYAANKKVSWASSNGDVATVSDEGKVIAIKEGTATITATSEEGGYTARCAVTVGNEAGARVYYKLNRGTDLYINGEPDPLTGKFNGSNFYYYSTYGICSDGADLYSVEVYSPNWYLCKNRKPLYEIPKTNSGDDLMSMTARNGTVAIVWHDWSSGRDYVVIIKPDGTSTTSYIDGSYARMQNVRSALAPNGDLYIAAPIKNSYGEYSTVLYKYSGGKWSETEISKRNHTPAIDISDEGDVYILRVEQSDGTFKDVLTKNGQELYAIQQPGYHDVALCTAGGHIYYAVCFNTSDENDQKIIEYCDGTVIRTLEQKGGGCFENNKEDFRPLVVTSTGDVYVATWYRIYKNDNQLFTLDSDYAYDMFCVVE